MCITVAIAAAALSVAAAGVGAYASIQGANAKAKQAKWEQEVRTKELVNQRELAKIEAAQRELQRDDEFARARSAAFAAIGASGLGEHISFFNAIDPEAQKAFLKDVRSIRLNLASDEVSITDQIRVTEYRSGIEQFNSGLSKVGAIADFIRTAASAASFYSSYSTPAPAGGAPQG